MLDAAMNAVDGFVAWAGRGLKQNIWDLLDVETADDEYTFVAEDGSLLTVIRLNGSRQIVGAEEFEKIVSTVHLSMKSYMANTGHAVQFFFGRDYDGAPREIRKALTPAFATAKRLNLALQDVLEERIVSLSDYCAKEEAYVVLWTTLACLQGKHEMQRAMQDKKEFYANNKVGSLADAQNIGAVIPDLRDRHASFVQAMTVDMHNAGLSCDKMEVHEAAHAMRMQIDPEFTDDDWRAFLPGDRVPLRIMKESPKDVSHVMWPPLDSQIMPRDAEVMDIRTVRIGDRIYAPIAMDYYPQQATNFQVLFNRVSSGGLPWRVSFLIEGDGLKAISRKTMLTAIFSWTGMNNKLINRAKKELEAQARDLGESIVALRVAFATWAPYDNVKLLRQRAAKLARAVEGWGQCQVSEVSGDPLEGTFSSALATGRYNVATKAAGPMGEIVTMLPFTRPASQWEQGAILFRTPDGKLMPFQPGSSQQTTWIDLIFARPGSGKSVLVNMSNLALCLSPGIQRLPRIAIIDIGPSSSGLISLLREALPENQRHLVAHHRMRMTRDYSINPFDTQLGSRTPTPQERAFLVNFLTLLATPVGKTEPYDGMADMAGFIVDEVFKLVADDGTPHIYSTSIDPKVDDALELIGYKKDKRTTWWEVVDALFHAGYTHEATLAQRHAVPVIADAASICMSEQIRNLFGKVVTPGGENVPEAFSRMLSSATREYPILGNPTAFDLGEARVVALDLDEVAKSGGEAADKQTAIMYMIARYVMARHYYLTEDNVTDFPQAYRSYHQQRIAEIREDVKRICMDEFHRTSKAKAVREQVILDMREGRKWGVHICLASQSIDDFDEVMVEFATSVFIMDSGPKQTQEKVANIFGLSDTARYSLAHGVHGPKKSGATFLAQFATKTGKITQLLTSTMGPIEAWAFSTTAVDAILRKKLYDAVGPALARRTLAKAFPGGSAAEEIERRKNALKSTNGFNSEDDGSVIDEIFREVMKLTSEEAKIAA